MPDSAAVAKLTIDLLDALQVKAGSGATLPTGLALTVNVLCADGRSIAHLRGYAE